MKRTIKDLLSKAKSVGYEVSLESISKQWEKEDLYNNKAIVLGPEKHETVSCSCNGNAGCEWCCGTKWLTKKVAEIKREIELND